MTPDQLADCVLAAAAAVLAERGLDPAVLPAALRVERPRHPEHGDYSSTVALQAGKAAGVPPRELAAAIAGKLASDQAIGDVQVAGPGFLNFRLTPTAAGTIAGAIVAQGRAYGHGGALSGQRINLEFVSANPTGPVHIGGARWAAVGDALARLLRPRARAWQVSTTSTTPGRRSTGSRSRCSPLPEASLHHGTATRVNTSRRSHVLSSPGILTCRASQTDRALAVLSAEGVELMFDEIKTSLAEFGVHFDVYFAEKDLHEQGELDAALARLEAAGKVYVADGATWVRTTEYGDGKDRVYVRRNGSFTYFAADCAYYLDKRGRGFDKVTIILGADHHGYVGRMRAIAACFGDDPDQTLEILIGQLVNLLRDGAPVRMSKRAGTVISLDDLTEAIGVDAARYALARYSIDSPIDLDLDMWARRSTDNPVYYVQYAHARIASLLRHAGEAGVSRGENYDAGLLSGERENDLLKALADFPGVVASAAGLRQPHRVARYLEQLAGTYHRFHDSCRILPRGSEAFDETGRARLWLAEAAKTVLANGLGLLGVKAPDRL